MRRTIIRISGRYGVRKLKLSEKPAIPIGSTVHIGQKSTAVPRVPAVPVALLVPIGQEPYFLRQTIKPILAEKSNAIKAEEIISKEVGCMRGGPVNPIGLRKPSSQLKSRPMVANDMIVAVQNRPALAK